MGPANWGRLFSVVWSPVFCLTRFLMDVRFLRGREGRNSRNYFCKEDLYQETPDQVRERRSGWNFFRWSRLSSLLLIRKIYEVWTENREERTVVSCDGRDLTSSQQIPPHHDTRAGRRTHLFSQQDPASSRMFCFLCRLKQRKMTTAASSEL